MTLYLDDQPKKITVNILNRERTLRDWLSDVSFRCLFRCFFSPFKESNAKFILHSLLNHAAKMGSYGFASACLFVWLSVSQNLTDCERERPEEGPIDYQGRSESYSEYKVLNWIDTEIPVLSRSSWARIGGGAITQLVTILTGRLWMNEWLVF